MEDQLYAELVHFHSVSEGKYPSRITMMEPKDRNSAKSNFRQRAKLYHVVEGVLMYGGAEVLLKTRVKDILYAYHDHPVSGGHFGRDKTHDKIKERYYWRGMRQQIGEYIKSCKKCFVTTSKMTAEAPPLHPISVPAQIWS